MLPRSMILVSGWSLFAFLCWKVSNAKTDNKLYNPFEILGISEVCAFPETLTYFVDTGLGYTRERDQVYL